MEVGLTKDCTKVLKENYLDPTSEKMCRREEMENKIKRTNELIIDVTFFKKIRP
jgi:hypothetical protein